MRRKNRILLVNAYFSIINFPIVLFINGDRKTARTSCLKLGKYPANIPEAQRPGNLSCLINFDYPFYPTFSTSIGSGYLSSNHMVSNSIRNTYFNPPHGHVIFLMAVANTSMFPGSKKNPDPGLGYTKSNPFILQ